MLRPLERRGPDGGGTSFHANVALGHRRLAIIAPGPEGAQPQVGPAGRWSLVYNGELYNDAELRERLAQEGRRPPHSRCDTATVLAVLEAWGIPGLARLRGMFALGIHDREEHRMHLLRDPMGIKPLYWSFEHDELVFASDPRAILAHPGRRAAPDLEGISAYLTSLRSCLGSRTLFQGLHCLAPGERLEWSTAEPGSSPQTMRELGLDGPSRGTVDPDGAALELRELMADTVERHLRSDRTTAVLLSGGLDSALISSLVRASGRRPRAYVAGAAEEGADGDLSQAAQVARELGLELRQLRLDRGDFLGGWDAMVQEGGMPLSTPNEVAIHALAKGMAADGVCVALGGEGADELFGGYGAIMDAVHAFESTEVPGMGPERFHLEAFAWISPASKAQVLRAEIWDAIDGDRALLESYAGLFEQALAEAGPGADPLEAHLRFLRRVNLTGLLERLDRSTMLASVEGRVPFADRAVRAFADGLPMASKFQPRRVLANGELEPCEEPRTKLVLRAAATGLVSEDVLRRPKTSFPLPMAEWIAGCGPELLASPFAQALFQEQALELVASDPGRHWAQAWPMLNLAKWGDRWF